MFPKLAKHISLNNNIFPVLRNVVRIPNSSISTTTTRYHEKPKLKTIAKGPGLEYFLANPGVQTKPQTKIDEKNTEIADIPPYLKEADLCGTGRKVYVEVYGCQMNVNDTEIVYSILNQYKYSRTSSVEEADVVLLMTCAIRDGAEQKIWGRLGQLRAMKQSRKLKENKNVTLGVIGCMAERLKHKLVEKEKSVDVVAGPDAYRQLPRLISESHSHQAAIDVMLSMDETYADIVPVRISPDSPSAYVSIMRGCDNMCTYCIVPFTRGKERSRPIDSIIDEVRHLSERGIKEITLLGQNVNSYRDTSESTYFGPVAREGKSNLVPGFKTVYKPKSGGRRFAELLDQVSCIDPEIRIRFTSPHPKDFPNEVLQLIRDRPNICKSLHLPAQSGNNRILQLMRRNYTREAYLELVDSVRAICGENVTLSSDFICGFCSETEEEFAETIDLVERVKYSVAFIFPYSMREKTAAHRRYTDDLPLEVKNDRVRRLVETFRQGAAVLNRSLINTTQLVLVEGKSKRSDKFLVGRNDGNVKVVFPDKLISNGQESSRCRTGQYVTVKITDANSQILKGVPLEVTTLTEFHKKIV